MLEGTLPHFFYISGRDGNAHPRPTSFLKRSVECHDNDYARKIYRTDM